MNVKHILRVSLIVLASTLAGMVSIFLFNAPFLKENCAVGPVRVSQNMTSENGVYQSIDQTLALKMLSMDIKLDHNTNYWISFVVNEIKAKEPILLTVDFVGENYDNNEQQFQMNLTDDMHNKLVQEVINSGKVAPATGTMRLFFGAPGTVRISNIRIIGERRVVIRDLKRIMLVIFVVLLVLGWVYFSKYGTDQALSVEKKIQLIISIIFLCMIITPALQKRFDLFHYPKLNENRRKLEPPTGNMIAALYRQGTDYSKAYEKYYNDIYGMRDFFIQLKNQLDYSLFKRSDKVVIGKRGQLEYKNVIAVEEIRGERLTEADWEKVYANLNAFKNYLNQRGITLILLPIEMKFSIYPEDYPKGLVVRPEETAFDHLLGYLDKHPDFHYVDARKTLLETKKNYRVFYRTDFHWTELGAFKVAENVVDTIGQMEGKPKTWKHNLEYTTEPGFDGGVNRYLAMFFSPKEDKIVLKKTWKTHGKITDAMPPFSLKYQADNPEDPDLLPKTLVIGNSFVHYYLQNNGFFEYFKEAYLLHSDHFRRLPEYLPEGTKYVVLQFLEIGIGNWLWNKDAWPKYEEK